MIMAQFVALIIQGPTCAIDMRIAHCTDMLNSPLSLTERELVFATLSDLFFFKYVLADAVHVQVQMSLNDESAVYTPPSPLHNISSGTWYIKQT